MTYQPRLVRLAAWLGQRWCGLTTGHAYIRQPDPWRLVLVCWHCSHESHGWKFGVADGEAGPRPSQQKGGSRW